MLGYLRITTAGLEEAATAVDRFRADLRERVTRSVAAATFTLQGEVKRQASGGTIGGPLSRQRGVKPGSGKLAQSFTTAFSVQGDQSIGIVGSPLVYSRIHEYGGTIRPRTKMWLTIPQTERAARRPAPLFGGLRFVPIRETLALLLDQAGLVQYILVKRSRIPARRYLTRASQIARPEIEKILGRGVDIAVRRVEEKKL